MPDPDSSPSLHGSGNTSPGAPGSADAKRRRILLVDDEEDLRTIGRMCLELNKNWQVDTAGSGAEALEAVQQSAPDVLLLDVMMPGMDGLQTLERLRSRAPATASKTKMPVVFLTAKTRKAEIAGYMAAGAAGVISKPFDPMTLAQQLDDILDGLPDDAPSHAAEESKGC